MALKMSESMARLVRSSRIRPSFTRVRLQSPHAGFERVDNVGLSPCTLVAGAMDCAVMGEAETIGSSASICTHRTPAMSALTRLVLGLILLRNLASFCQNNQSASNQ
jgi:hypothetical protein